MKICFHFSSELPLDDIRTCEQDEETDEVARDEFFLVTHNNVPHGAKITSLTIHSQHTKHLQESGDSQNNDIRVGRINLQEDSTGVVYSVTFCIGKSGWYHKNDEG